MNPELIILAQILLEPEIWYKTELTEEHFHDGNALEVYKAMKTMIADGVEIDEMSLADYAEVPVGFISDLTAPTAVNWQYYQAKVIDEHRRVGLARLATQLADWAKTLDYADVMDNIEDALHRISATSKSKQILESKAIISEVIGDIMQAVENKTGVGSGITTGIHGLDAMTLGLQKGLMYVVAARPSEGKTALALTMAAAATLHEKRTAGFISLETSATGLVRRVISQESSIQGQNITTGYLQPLELGKVTAACEKIGEAKLYIYDEPNMELSTLKTVARRMATFHKVEVIYIDYVQIVTYKDATMPRHERIAEVSKACKQLARELNIPIVVLSQLGRDAEGQRPGLRHLSDTRQLEQDADVVVFIYHDSKAGPHESELIIAKARDGELGTVHVTFEREYVRFKQRVVGDF